MPRIATDPPVSEKQRRAMWAAAEGRSTLGIPKSVGREFVGKDYDPKNAAGVCVRAPDGAILFLRRTQSGDHAGEWCLPGGTAEPGERPEDSAYRELREETGYSAVGLNRLYHDDADANFVTFLHHAPQRFDPNLSDGEHDAFMWARPDNSPGPLHPGVAKMLGQDVIRLDLNLSTAHRTLKAMSKGVVLDLAEDAVLLFELPVTGNGLFKEPPKYDAEFEQGEVKRREIAANHFHYADDIDAGMAHTYDPLGRYNCGRCNQVTPAGGTHCELVDIKAVDPSAGSCGHWEKIYAADKEIKNLRQLSAEAAAYGVAVNGYGFGCIRCPWGWAATVPDSAGRDWFCGKFAARMKTTACCELNGAATKDMAEDALATSPNAGFPPVTVRFADDGRAVALDAETTREYDKDGRLHISLANISKACVNPYLGREIPNYLELGLQPDRKYRLLRHPDELAKAAPSFNGLPLLIKHMPVDAEDHAPDLTVGATGTDAVFAAPYLKNSLVIWPRKAIDGVETDERRELSCGYYYRADMTPGVYEGASYDGVMRDIVGNHVALVEKGRAGPDVVVGDSAFEATTELSEVHIMAKTKVAAYLHGALSHYFKAPSKDVALAIDMALSDVTGKTFLQRKPAIKAKLAEIKATIAKDADLDGMHKFIDRLDELGGEDVVEAQGGEKEPHEPTVDAAEEYLKEKLSKDEYEEWSKRKASMDKKAKDAMEEKEKEMKAKDMDMKAKDQALDELRRTMVTQTAMDSAIKAAVEAATATVRKSEKDLREAIDHVRPWVGELKGIALDSAEGVYRAALTTLGVKGVEELPATALKHVLDAQPKPGSRQRTETIAVDAAGAKGFAERFPRAAGMTHV